MKLYNDDCLKVLPTLNNQSIDFILTDPSGIISIDLGAYGVPETFIIKNKKIVKKFIGPLNEKKLKEIIKLKNK